MGHAQILGSLHLLVIMFLSWQTASVWVRGLSRRMCATLLFVWSNLVVTSLSVSCFTRLNDVLWYGGASLSLALTLWLLGTHVIPDEERMAAAGRPWRGERAFTGLLTAAMVVCGVLSFYILWTHSPSNWDSSGYRFPRALFALQHGNLMHFANPYWDPRALYYPYNGTILYIFLGLYQFGEIAFTGVTLVAWAVSGLGVYTTSRRLGATVSGAVMAAFLGLVAPAVLSQAASTNDEILAASAMLLALPFAVDWVTTARRRFGFLAGAGIGLAVGTKLHWTFYYPYLILAAVVAGVWVARHWEALRPQMGLRTTGLVLAAVPVALFGGSFLVTNWMSSGEVTSSFINNLVLNKPFNPKLAWEKLYGCTGQLFLAPIPDILRHGSKEDVARQYEVFNRTVDQALFSSITEMRKISIEGYQFKGPLSDGANSDLMNEYTVFAGLLPWLLVAVVALAGFRRDVNRPALWIAGSLLAWHVCYVVHMKYIPGAAAYYAYPVVIAAAGLGPLWDWSVARGGVGRRVLAGVFVVTALTHLIVASHIFHYNTLRNVYFGWTKHPAANANPVSPAMREAIRMSGRIHIPQLMWSQLMWHLMRHNLAAGYTTGKVHEDGPADELQLVGLLAGSARGHGSAVALPRGATSSAIYLGEAFGQRYYGTGAVAMGLHPEQMKIALAGVSMPPVPKGMRVRVGDPWVGARFSDGMEYRASLAGPSGRRVMAGPWRLISAGASEFNLEEPEMLDEVWVDVRHPSRPKEYVRTHIPFGNLYAAMPGVVEVLSDEAGGAGSALTGGPVASSATAEPAVPAPPAAPKGPKLAVPDAGQGRALAVRMIAPAAQQVGTSFDKIDYVVRWVPTSTAYEFMNHGAARDAEFALLAAKGQRSRTLRLRVNGKVAGKENQVTKTLWVNGMDDVRFPVRLEKGLNRFELFSPEEAEALNADKVCCLLVGVPVLIVP